MPRKPTQQSKAKGGDNHPVKDFDFNQRTQEGVKTLANFANQAQGSISGALGGRGVISFLQNPGDLEKEIIKKGMKKGEAAAAAGGVTYMNNQELLEAREKEQAKMRARRNVIDLEEDVG